jgi:hypothetical protein
MGSYLGYTVYPVDEVSLETLQEILNDGLDNTVMDVYHHDDPEWVESRIYNEHGTVGMRVSTSSRRSYEDGRLVEHIQIDIPRFRESIVEWLARYVEQIVVVFITQIHNTSDKGTLHGYRPVDGVLREMRSENVCYVGDRTRSWPDHGQLYHRERGENKSKAELQQGVEYLAEFEQEFGYRPLTFYR